MNATRRGNEDIFLQPFLVSDAVYAGPEGMHPFQSLRIPEDIFFDCNAKGHEYICVLDFLLRQGNRVDSCYLQIRKPSQN